MPAVHHSGASVNHKTNTLHPKRWGVFVCKSGNICYCSASLADPRRRGETMFYNGCDMFGFWYEIKTAVVVFGTWLLFVTLMLCGIFTGKTECYAAAIGLMIVYGHQSLRNDEAVVIMKRLDELEKKLSEGIAQIKKNQGGG